MLCDQSKADRVIRFLSMLKHVTGRWAGVNFHLLDWQTDIVNRAFGTVREDGFRQYRIVFVEIPKKNGKTELVAGLSLYLLIGDKEPGAEVYSAAGDKEQASIMFKVAAQMARQNPYLSKRLKIVDSQRLIVDRQTNSAYKALSSEVYTKHGINPHAILFDEIHAQPNRNLWDTLIEGTDAARDQQIVFVITTAGVYDKNHIAWQLHSKALAVQKGAVDDPSFLPILYLFPEEKLKEDSEAWRNPKTWAACNPSMGHVFSQEKIQRYYKTCKGDPIREAHFKRFRLNIWTAAAYTYIQPSYWNACAARIDWNEMKGKSCYAGLDLSSTTDLTALAVLFLPDSPGGKYRLKCHFWMPEDTIRRRANEDRVPYDVWVKQGWITATPGNVVDYAFIRKQISGYEDRAEGPGYFYEEAVGKIYQLEELAFDPWGAAKLAVELSNNDGLPLVEFRQGYKSMSPALKEFQRMIVGGEIEHDDNPVLAWNINNMMVDQDAAGNVKPSKAKSTSRIDGAVASIMAVGRAILVEGNGGQSIYESRPSVIVF